MSGRPILYNLDVSPPARTVLMVAKFINLELEIKNLDMFGGEHLKNDFLQINPSHTVPTLTDDGQHIWEGAAICTYLIGKYGPKECSLYPTDLLTRARIDQRLYYNAAILFPTLRAGTMAIFFQNLAEVPDNILQQAYGALDHLERFLVDDNFLVGNSLTLADLAVITTVNNLQIWLPIDANKYGRILAWLDRVGQAFPEFEEMNKPHMVEYTEFHKAKKLSILNKQ